MAYLKYTSHADFDKVSHVFDAGMAGDIWLGRNTDYELRAWVSLHGETMDAETFLKACDDVAQAGEIATTLHETYSASDKWQDTYENSPDVIYNVCGYTIPGVGLLLFNHDGDVAIVQNRHKGHNKYAYFMEKFVAGFANAARTLRALMLADEKNATLHQRYAAELDNDHDLVVVGKGE